MRDNEDDEQQGNTSWVISKLTISSFVVVEIIPPRQKKNPKSNLNKNDDDLILYGDTTNLLNLISISVEEKGVGRWNIDYCTTTYYFQTM